MPPFAVFCPPRGGVKPPRNSAVKHLSQLRRSIFTSSSRQYRPPFGPGIPAGVYMSRKNRAGLTMSTVNAHELWLAAGLRTPFARVDGPLAPLAAVEVSAPGLGARAGPPAGGK